ncbi:unnamed protein product [Microthlaspi erraticum]|uniref:Pentacotripeptide-repeat region of PRORP domain-containing protein n=1 Tax=Microthlaspi erraticum TaxID=1685480 RepID=A0A6D2KSN1_9BRAS|nr:unnamed protein product [Microthlaspi erraticum]
MSSPAISSSRCFVQRLMMSLPKPKPTSKPYPVGRDHPRKQRQDCTNIRGPLSLLQSRVRFLIHDVSDLDIAAKHARSVVRKRNPERAISTCKAIIGAMCDNGRSGDALDLFDFFFNEFKMKPDIATCNLIVKSHCEQSRLNDALELYNHLSSYHTPSPDHKTYDLLTKALVDAGSMDQALDLLLRGRNDLFNFLEPAMYMNLIRGYLERGNLDMAYQLRDDFKTCSTRNKITILNSAFVEYLFKQGNDEEAMGLYRTSLNNNGFTSNGAVGNAYLKVLLKYGKKTQAWSLFRYMVDNFDGWSAFREENINMMVNECFETGRFSDAVNIFAETKAKVDYLSVGAYRNLITRLCQNGRLSDAENVFGEFLKEYVTEADAATYKALIHAYVEAGREDDALQTVNKMIVANFHKVNIMFL